ncbi:hypothetical protein GCM10019059_35700 [Camelimonas fluminis]|nr:hypothetical protein GCM10019059_35700 [Camelimonas fluminis]
MNSELTDARHRVRFAGERSWAEAYLLAATYMLPNEIRKALTDAADALIGRERHEIARGS